MTINHQPSTTLPHILIIDDDTRLRGLLRKYLSENGFLPATAANATDARAALASMRFDLIVLDVMMPGETGLEFLKQLRRESETPVLMLTAQGTTSDRITGLETGADDYLTKPFEPKELVLRIKSILKRQEKTARASAPAGLTTAEETLLAILSERPGEAISRASLAARLGNINERGVDVQINRLRKKLGDDPKNPAQIQTVRGAGYRLNKS